MDIREISYIIAIADKQSITAAAASLFISQPALSQALRRMEAEAGCKLFVRSGNMTVPTEAGRLLVERGRLILNARDKMLSDVRGVAAATKRCDLAYRPFIASIICRMCFATTCKTCRA